jgi:hypothetical protein
MNLQLGIRTLALLAIVAASTVVIVKPELVGGTKTAAYIALVAPHGN